MALNSNITAIDSIARTSSKTPELPWRARALGAAATHQLGEMHRGTGIDISMLEALSNSLSVAEHWRFQPSIEHFRATVTEPGYDRFVSEGRSILDDAGQRMAELLSGIDYSADDAAARRSAVQLFADALQLPATTLHTGDKWHRRLRWRALTMAAASRPQHRGDGLGARYRRAELELLDSSPWCYQDRLLSSFEAAHRELVEHRDGLVSHLRDVASLGPDTVGQRIVDRRSRSGHRGVHT